MTKFRRLGFRVWGQKKEDVDDEDDWNDGDGVDGDGDDTVMMMMMISRRRLMRRRIWRWQCLKITMVEDEGMLLYGIMLLPQFTWPVCPACAFPETRKPQRCTSQASQTLLIPLYTHTYTVPSKDCHKLSYEYNVNIRWKRLTSRRWFSALVFESHVHSIVWLYNIFILILLIIVIVLVVIVLSHISLNSSRNIKSRVDHSKRKSTLDLPKPLPKEQESKPEA